MLILSLMRETVLLKAFKPKLQNILKAKIQKKILKALLCKNGALGFCLYTHMQKQYRDPRKFF